VREASRPHEETRLLGVWLYPRHMRLWRGWGIGDFLQSVRPKPSGCDALRTPGKQLLLLLLNVSNVNRFTGNVIITGLLLPQLLLLL